MPGSEIISIRFPFFLGERSFRFGHGAVSIVLTRERFSGVPLDAGTVTGHRGAPPRRSSRTFRASKIIRAAEISASRPYTNFPSRRHNSVRLDIRGQSSTLIIQQLDHHDVYRRRKKIRENGGGRERERAKHRCGYRR